MARRKGYTTQVLTVVILVLAVVLFMRGGEIITAMAGFVSYNTSVTTVSTTNQAPVIQTTAFTPEGITLSGGQTTTLTCTATMFDDNGYSDINKTSDSTNATFYLNSTTNGHECTLNNRNCYRNTSDDLCSNVGGATNATCTWTTIVQWNANYSNWNCTVGAIDTATPAKDTTNIGVEDQEEIASLIAMDLTDAQINFGSLGPGSNSTDTPETVENYGNTKIDMQLNGTDMTGCSSGEITSTNITANCTDVIEHHDQGTDMWINETSRLIPGCEGFDLDTNTTVTTEVPVAPQKDVHFMVHVPSGVSGSCTGTVWFIAVQG